ncbi:uncharacterized protein G2W53_037220 [Senna tora]|uniref:Uncharacterized protein n=1 Tax=Senna tora TaxID=362788 RepID=A0A834SVJ7_9FABA|nr:uncharacterized protein G2W53_037220 [Senna tora]
MKRVEKSKRYRSSPGELVWLRRDIELKQFAVAVRTQSHNPPFGLTVAVRRSPFAVVLPSSLLEEKIVSLGQNVFRIYEEQLKQITPHITEEEIENKRNSEFAKWLKEYSRSVINAPELAYQEDEVSIQNEIDDDDEDPQEELGDEEEVGEEVEIEIEDDDVNDQEDIVEMDEFNDQDDIEGGFEIDDSSTEDENEDNEDQIDYGMTRGKGKARSTGVDRGGYHKVGRNKSIESVQCPTMKQVPVEQVPIVQPPIEQVPIVQPPIEQVPVVDRPPSYVAEEDHLESEEPSMTNTQQENAYLQVRSQPRISPDGRTYLEPLRDSYHPHSAIRELTKIIKKYFHGPWATWEGTPTDVKDRWFGELEVQDDCYTFKIHDLRQLEKVAHRISQIHLRPYDILLDYREVVSCLDVSQAYVWSLQYLHLALGSPFVSSRGSFTK